MVSGFFVEGSRQRLHLAFVSFLLGITVVPREIEDNAYAKCLGANEMYYGRCANGK